MELNYLINSFTWKKILGENYQLNNNEIMELNTILSDLTYSYMETVCKFILYKVNNFSYRLSEIKKHPQLQSIDMFINRYGDIHGPLKFNEFKNNKPNSLEAFIKKHGEEKGIYLWNCRKNSKENRIKKYGSKEESENKQLEATQKRLLTNSEKRKNISTLDIIIKYKAWKDIVGHEYILNETEKKEVESVADIIKDNFNYIKIVATFIKYKVNNFKNRLIKLIPQLTSSSLEAKILRYGEIEGNKRYYELKDKLKNKPQEDKLSKIQKMHEWTDILGNDYILSENEIIEIKSIIDYYKDETRVIYLAEFVKYKLSDYRLRYDNIIKNPYGKDLDFFKLRYGNEIGITKYNESNYAKKRDGLEIITNNIMFKKILGSDFQLTDEHIKEINSSLDIIKDYAHINIVLNFIKYNLTDFRSRLIKILETPNSVSLDQNILKYGEIEGTTRYNNMCLEFKKTNSIQGYIDRYGEEGKDIFQKIQDSKKITESRCIERHGEEKGKVVFDNFCKRNEGNWTLERQIELLGEIDGTKRFNEIKDNVKFTSSLSGYIKRHGENLGKQLWFRRMRNMWFNSSRFGYIQKYGELNGLKIMKERKNNTSLISFIKRHGKIEGELKYKKWISSCCHIFFGYSEMASNFFRSIIEKIHPTQEILYKPLTQEFHKFDQLTKKSYFYDFTIPSIKYCIEFNGDVWHANPEKYKPTDTPNPFDLNITSEEIWKRDKIKQDFLRSQSYTLKIIWESDYHQNKDQIIQECIDEINHLVTEKEIVQYV
jgi:hypothetical protein